MNDKAFSWNLSLWRMGFDVGFEEAISLATLHGFESIDPNGGPFLGEGARGNVFTLPARDADELSRRVSDAGLTFATAWLPFELSGDEEEVKTGLARLPTLAEALRRLGAPGFSVGISPANDELNYLENLDRWRGRVHDCAAILSQYDLRLALEYVGPRTSWSSGRYPFIHSLREARTLLNDLPSLVGLHLDSWHWHTAHDSVDDLAALDGSSILGVDLNDAPAGIPTDDLFDMRRELPATTGMIPIGQFLSAVAATGFTGPIQVEPFNATLSSLDVDAAVVATVQSLRRASDGVEPGPQHTFV